MRQFCLIRQSKKGQELSQPTAIRTAMLREPGGKEMFLTSSWSPQANTASLCGGAAPVQPGSHG